MKRIFASALAMLSLTPVYASGDFVPGRVRASAEAALSRVQGDGRYGNVTSAHATELNSDGKGVTGFLISLDRRPLIDFAVRSVHTHRCGRIYLAAHLENGRNTELRIDETSADACGGAGKTSWRVSLVTDEANGNASSHLVLIGIPQFLMLTQ